MAASRAGGPLGLRYPQFTGAAHERFGATFSIRPGTMAPVVLTSDRDAIQRLLTGDPLVRHHGDDAVRPLIGDRSVMLLDPAQHLARRKLLLPQFHGERVRTYADLHPSLVGAVEQLIDFVTEPVDAAHGA